MQNSDNIIIMSENVELLNDLRGWLAGEFQIVPVNTCLDEHLISLGDSNGIAVVLNFIKDNFDKLVTLLKNWAANYNKDIEITFEYGDKKATLKCPARRVSDDQIEEVFSTLSDFYN